MKLDNSAIPKLLMLNAALGAGYYTLCSKWNLLTSDTLQSQIGMLAISTAAQTLSPPSETQAKSLTFHHVIPLVLITATKVWTDITWKAQLMSTLVLGGSQVCIHQNMRWYQDDAPGGAPPAKPNKKPREIIEVNCSKTIGTTKIQIATGDITTQPVEAIVNAANDTLLGGGGIDGAIHKAAEDQLKEACAKFPEIDKNGDPQKGTKQRILVGHAKITPSFNIQKRNANIQYVVHTVGPLGSTPNREKLLTDAYHNSLVEAHSQGIKSIAFPAISVGVFAYPLEEAQAIAFKTVKAYIQKNPTHFETIIFAYLKSDQDALYVARESWKEHINS